MKYIKLYENFEDSHELLDILNIAKDEGLPVSIINGHVFINRYLDTDIRLYAENYPTTEPLMGNKEFMDLVINIYDRMENEEMVSKKIRNGEAINFHFDTNNFFKERKVPDGVGRMPSKKNRVGVDGKSYKRESYKIISIEGAIPNNDVDIIWARISIAN